MDPRIRIRTKISWIRNTGYAPSSPTSNAGKPVQEVFSKHGERIVVATKGLAGGAAQARVVAPRVAAARGVVPLIGNNCSFMCRLLSLLSNETRQVFYILLFLGGQESGCVSK